MQIKKNYGYIRVSSKSQESNSSKNRLVFQKLIQEFLKRFNLSNKKQTQIKVISLYENIQYKSLFKRR